MGRKTFGERYPEFVWKPETEGGSSVVQPNIESDTELIKRYKEQSTLAELHDTERLTDADYLEIEQEAHDAGRKKTVTKGVHANGRNKGKSFSYNTWTDRPTHVGEDTDLSLEKDGAEHVSEENGPPEITEGISHTSEALSEEVAAYRERLGYGNKNGVEKKKGSPRYRALLAVNQILLQSGTLQKLQKALSSSEGDVVLQQRIAAVTETIAKQREIVEEILTLTEKEMGIVAADTKTTPEKQEKLILTNEQRVYPTVETKIPENPIRKRIEESAALRAKEVEEKLPAIATIPHKKGFFAKTGLFALAGFFTALATPLNDVYENRDITQLQSKPPVATAQKAPVQENASTESMIPFVIDESAVPYKTSEELNNESLISNAKESTAPEIYENAPDNLPTGPFAESGIDIDVPRISELELSEQEPSVVTEPTIGTPVNAESMESTPRMYTVKRGDNVWNYSEGDIKGVSMSLELTKVPENKRNEVLAFVRAELVASEKLRIKVGITSGNPDRIYPGDVLNGTELDALVKRVVVQRNIVTL